MGIRCITAVTAILSFICIPTVTPRAMNREAAPTGQEAKLLTESDLLTALRTLRDDMLKIQSELGGQTTGGRPDRKGMSYEDYRTAFEGVSGKLDEAYRRISVYYAQIDRIYRTTPNSPLYKQITQVYLEAKAAYDGAKTALGGVAPPDSIRAVSVVSTDRRLNDRVAASVKDEGPATRSVAAQEILQSDESRYIGTFDAVEMFLLVKGDAACYVLFGWKEQFSDESGKKTERYHLSVVRTEFFPVASLAASQSPNQHLEHALKLPLVPVDARGDVLNDLNQFLTRVKSYARTN